MGRGILRQNDNMEEFEDLISSMIEGTGIYEWKNNTITVVQSSAALASACGYTDEEYEALVSDNVLKSICEEDQDHLYELLESTIREKRTGFDGFFRFIHKSGRRIWFKLVAGVGGSEQDGYVIKALFMKQRNEEQAVQDLKNNLQIAMKHTRMIYWEYVFDESRAYVADLTQQFLGVPAIIDDYPESYLAMKCVAEEDVPIYRESLKRMREGEPYVEFTARIRTAQQEYAWMKLRFTGLTDEKGRAICAVCTAETIAEYKELENRFRTILEQNNINTWLYDIPRHTIILAEGGLTELSDRYASTKEIPDIPEAHIRDGFCHPDDAETLRKMHREMENGCRQVTYKIRFWTDAYNDYRWKRCTYTVITDQDNRPVYAIGSGVDITDEIEEKARYQRAVEFREHTQAENVLLSGHCSITNNKILEMNDLTGEELVDRFGTVRDEFYRGIGSMICDEEQKKEFYRLFLTEPAKQMYELGKTQYSFQCEMKMGKEGTGRCWIQMSIVKAPETGNLEAFLIVTDITKEKQQENILFAVTGQDYDYVMVVDVHRDYYELYAASDDKTMRSTPVTGLYSDTIREYAKRYVLPEDRAVAVDGLSVSFLQKKLEKEAVYTSQARLLEEDGVVRYKQVKCTYLDERHDNLLITRIDITNIVQEEERKKQELSEALAKAEQATKAKSEFLSRMSHDLRTPMNAIIGLSALTIDDAGNPAVVCDNMSKMRTASDYMLDLVNDILDMAKIEDGSVVLNTELYRYREFLLNLETMFRSQCEAKEIRLLIDNSEEMPDCVADKVRINQIFYNVLSNALKYTKRGGTIHYYIENLSTTDKEMTADFIVEDTGIGMSEEFLQHVFEPFVQEDEKVTPELQGSGLGLSITRQLVELMGGNIHIDSKKGIGTKVTIHLTFTRAGECRAESSDVAPGTVSQNSLEGRTVLLAEDHPLNAQIARRLLEKKGVIVLHAEDGQVAVDMFRSSPVGSIDAVLMDIRMPVMSGLDATREIRRLKRSDAATVPIIAMSANAYADDRQKSMDAGMNEHLAKPVEPSVLYETLEKLV